MANHPIEDALEIADRIVRVQGSIFIKELLRQKKRAGYPVQIGSRKDDVLSNLREAIEDGWITLDDLQQWLAETEGWGKQHVYLFQLSDGVSDAAQFSNPEAFAHHLEAQDLIVEPEDELLFPDRLMLEPIEFENGIVRMVWKRGRHEWARDSEMDHEQDIGGDRYQFKAWRYEARRAVQRCFLNPRDQTGVLFIQMPLGEEHSHAVEEAHETIERLLAPHSFRVVSMSSTIRGLDQSDPDGAGGELPDDQGELMAQDTRFRARGASIQFSADPDINSYRIVEPVRRVRLALRADDFTGDFARVSARLTSGTGMNRIVRVTIHGNDDRAYFHSQMTRDEVWAIVTKMFDVLP